MDNAWLKVCATYVLWSLQLDHNSQEKSCCHILKLRERFSFPTLFQYVKTLSVILNQRVKDIPWYGTTKKKKFSLCHHVRSRQQSSGTVRGWFLGMWWSEVRQSILMPMSVYWKNSWKRFRPFHPHKNKAEISSAWQYQAAHKLEDLGSHYMLWLGRVTSFTLLQRSSTLSLLQGCLEPWRRLSITWSLKTMIMWLAHLELGYMNRTKCGRQKIHAHTHTHTHTLILIGTRLEKWRESLWKCRYAVKPSVFILCNFYNIEIHVSRGKKYGVFLSRQSSYLFAGLSQ